MAGKTKKQGKKGRKIGRNKEKCARYAAEGRREKNNPLRTPRPGNQTPHFKRKART